MGQGSLGGRRRDAYTLPRDKPGPTRRTARPDGLWALALFDSKKRLLFLTVPLGDGYHGYKSIWGVCQSPVEYKEGAPPTLSRGHAEKTDSKARCTNGADSITPTLQLRKVRLTEFTQATLGGPGLKPRWPRASAALLYHQDVWGPVPVASCPSLNVSVPHVLIS